MKWNIMKCSFGVVKLRSRSVFYTCGELLSNYDFVIYWGSYGADLKYICTVRR